MTRDVSRGDRERQIARILDKYLPPVDPLALSAAASARLLVDHLADYVKAVRAEALEQAAKECEASGQGHLDAVAACPDAERRDMHRAAALAANLCAARIRAMANDNARPET